jgi:predicted esterase
LLSIYLAWLPPVDSRAAEEEPLPPITRRLPPVGKALPAEIAAELNAKLGGLEQRMMASDRHELRGDIAVLLKAVRFALEQREFYKAGDEKKAERLLAEAGRRLQALGDNTQPWTSQRGLVARGFISAVDGSPQPYGMHIPENLDLSQPQPLIVWLHGRGDSNTDLHFIADRMQRGGEVSPPWAYVLHPFGRQCVGFKSAGETDVLEAIEHVRSQYKIDEDRIILMGFSMGGAGAWHMGAHYAGKWAAVSPGAGFADTARYQRLLESEYPPSYEQKLWGVYDVPPYVRNLFNVPVVAYSGELDKQIQAAQLMEEAFAGEGRKLTHLIGQGMGHKYHPDVLTEIVEHMHTAAKAGRPELPREIHLQTRTLRYNTIRWVEALRLEQHWLDSRIDADLADDQSVVVTTKNIASLRLTPWPSRQGQQVTIDGQQLRVPTAGERGVVLEKHNNQWRLAPAARGSEPLAKRPGLQGPIDDAFREPFLFVLPSGPAAHPLVGQWVEYEAAHQQRRWRELMRGTVRVKRDTEVTAEDVARYHLILWGDPASNRLLNEFVGSDQQPLGWDAETITLGGASYAADKHVPAMIYPNPANPARYVVINSGLTFREAHDRTNSLQNPKLPDWAVLDITVPPTAEAAGRVVAAEFFDEDWQ